MKQNKKIYEAPAMQVVELKHRQMLLAGSDRNSPQMDEEYLFNEEE